MKNNNFILKKINKLRLKGSFQRKSFILILLIASIPGLITGLSMYWFVIQNVEKELQTLHENQIDQRAKNMDEQFNYIEYSTSRWAFEPRFGDSLQEIDFVKDFEETYDITKTLLLLQSNHVLINKVSLYLNTDKPILFSNEYNVLTDERSSFYEKNLEKGKSIQWVQLPDSNGTLALVQNIPAASSRPFGSIIVTVDRQKSLELLKTLTPYDKGATFIMNEEREIILASNSTHNDQFVSALKGYLEENQKNEKAFLYEYNGNTYSVSLGAFSRINDQWTYVSAAPMSSITAPLLFVSRLIIFISASALLLAWILSWIASRRIYSPVNRLIQNLLGEQDRKLNVDGKDEFLMIEQQWEALSEKSALLQNRLSEQVDDIKTSFLLQLMQGSFYYYNEQDLQKRMESYGWEVRGQSFTALGVQLTGIHDSAGNFSNQDESLLAFMTANILEELGENFFNSYTVIRFSDLSAGVLVIYPAETNIRSELLHFSEQVTNAVNEIMNVQVTVTLSKPAETIKQIPQLFEEIRMGSRLRAVDNQNQIIDLLHTTEENAVKEVRYPFPIEKEIIQAIRMGEVEEIHELIYQFLMELKEKSANGIYVQQGIIQLYSSIQHEILYSGIHPHELFNGKNMIEELSQIRELNRTAEWFMNQVIMPYLEQIKGRMNVELKRLVESVIVKIQKEYMQDISLESCADEVGTNPYSLSKAFKQVAGINFIDYLTDLRMEKAKELLANTDMKINDVAESVGYRHSYFNRIFKKQMGIPPSQFRKQREAADGS
ncbi:helix-turn-helix domain-containing protein [Domibacillus indicus]|uniref:helix-turn-helix domain-containing protein n=1 Tax=Domibacillus indicus TaxID=1437523 RepID=UPI0006984D35|nr:helix-turn-helix domain-containing protein [Domibacillus indicus]